MIELGQSSHVHMGKEWRVAVNPFDRTQKVLGKIWYGVSLWITVRNVCMFWDSRWTVNMKCSEKARVYI